MTNYDPKKIEKKWQKKWEETGIYQVGEKSSKPKWYSLIEFPYPSGEGLHVGHIRSNTAMDIISRKRRMEGFNVLYPIGWDAFGLPTENYAIKTGIHPIVATKKNTGIFRKQLKAIGFSFDWNREINTSNPNYYRWTQWIFLQLFKEGLAYKQRTFINWCLSCKTGLANEEVVGGNCERCGTPIVKREKDQWMLAITKYADRLDKDLDKVDYLPEIKQQQRNWIGRSEGSELKFKLVSKSKPADKKQKADKTKVSDSISVFTTRPDTLFGVTYVVLAPEHDLVSELMPEVENQKEVETYIKKTLDKTDTERQTKGKEKTGVELKGIKVINPANNEEVPVFIADYVLASYGTGAVMAVPAHDERDWAFAVKYELPIRYVVLPVFGGKNQSSSPVGQKDYVHCILRDSKTGEIGCLKWHGKEGKTSFISGEIVPGEDFATTAKKEVIKQSGYLNIKFIKEIGQCFGDNKNSSTNNQVLLFELVDYSQFKIDSVEKEKAELVWLTSEKVAGFLSTGISKFAWTLFQEGQKPYVDYGVLTNSGKFDGQTSESVKKDITKFAGGKIVTKYKLRDWVFSRQHYWGEPIPLVFCEKDGWVAIPEKDLPVKLPKIKNYKPADNGESPLASELDWVNTKCPTCGGPAKRETDTMPNWAGSSWYFLRYTDPANMESLADPKKLAYWQPVDWYNGGAEHITLHLLYSRFWNKFLYDIGVVPVDEPYRKRTTHGMILGEGGIKMSKSRGNVVNPDEIVKTYGADTLRVYEMFMGPFDQAIVWSTENIIGSRRFLEKIWQISKKVGKRKPIESFDSLTHKMIKKVGEDIEQMSFNTAISTMMVWVNEADKQPEISVKLMSDFLKILAPFAPHLAEELWFNLGHKKTIHLENWPAYDESKLLDKWVNIVIQINGKVRDTFEIETGTDQSGVEEMAFKRESVKRWLSGLSIKKCVYIQDRLLNIVV